MKVFQFCFALLCIASSAFSQQADSLKSSSPNDSLASPPKSVFLHPYKVNYWVSGSIILVGVATDVPAINRIKGKPTISDAEIASLNTSAISSFDSWALTRDPTKAEQYDHLSDNMLTATIFLPALLAINKNIRHDWLPLLVMYAEAQSVVFTIYNYSFLGPTFQNKFRPIVYYDSIPLANRENGNGRNSFYSGHVATASLATFMMTKIYCDYHPEMGATKYLLYAAATIPPLALGYVRVLALKHFPSDDLVGLGLGAVCGIVIPELHKNKNNRTDIGMFTTPNGGAGFTLKWNPNRTTAL